MMPKILRFAGYFLAFVLFLLLFVRMTFPTEAVGNMLKVRIAEGVGATDVQIADVSLLGLIPSGVELSGIEIAFKDVAMKTERPNENRMVGRMLQADEIAIHASLGALSSGEIDATFEGTVMGGRIEGGRLLVPKEGVAEVRIETIDGVALGAERLFAAATGFDVNGTLSGSIDLKLPITMEEGGKRVPQLAGLEGSINLTIAGAMVKDPVVERMQMRQALTDVKLGDVKLVAKATGTAAAAAGDKGGRPRGGNTTILLEELSASGPDIQLAVAPRAALVIPSGRPFNQATLRTHFAIKVDEGYINREIDDPKAPGKKTQPNKIIGALLEDLARKGHAQDGDIGLAVTGPLAKPTVATEKPRTRIGAAGAGGRRMNVEAGDEPPEGDEGETGTEAPKPPTRSSRQAGSVTRPAIGGGRPVAASPLGDDGLDRAMPGKPPQPVQPVMPPEPAGGASPEPMPEPEPNFESDPVE
jgi:type II secretion system protein N